MPTYYEQEIRSMLTKISMTLAVMIAVASAAVAAEKRHPIHPSHRGAISDMAAAHQGSHPAARAYGSAPPADACRQTGPITMPATDPACNRRGWLMGN